jgi:ppGpp synthetase/RelA/SpoT-type nucleotidyltranferase
MKKPGTLEEYKDWCREFLQVNFDDDTSRTRYETNLNIAYLAAESHIFFEHLDRKLEEWSNHYEKTTNSQLLMNQSNLKLVKKPYESAIDKSFRINALWNDDFPKEPKKGWVTPRNLHFYFNDGIRGYLVCRFIDGPRFIAEQLRDYAKNLGLKSRFYSQERDEGYYAYHFYVTIGVSFIDESFKKVNSEIEIEIQLTTQLQEVLKNLTHQFYQANRLKPSSSSKWKWEYKTINFRIGYISHTLHLLESIIIEIRDGQLETKDASEKSEYNSND